MGGTCEENEYRKSPKTNFTLSTESKKINQMFNEEMGDKHETVTGHLD
jgi:hypothetical protein